MPIKEWEFQDGTQNTFIISKSTISSYENGFKLNWNLKTFEGKNILPYRKSLTVTFLRTLLVPNKRPA